MSFLSLFFFSFKQDPPGSTPGHSKRHKAGWETLPHPYCQWEYIPSYIICSINSFITGQFATTWSFSLWIRRPTFAHVAVVRKKDERRKLKGTTCKECETVSILFMKPTIKTCFKMAHIVRMLIFLTVLRPSPRGGETEEVVRMLEAPFSLYSSLHSWKLLGSWIPINSNMHWKR